MPTSTATITINAPAARVWDALTKPELVKDWQYGSELVTDWQVGRPIRFRSEWQGQVFEQWGTVLEVEPHHVVRYSLFAPRPGLEDTPENYFVMSYVLEGDAHGTTLSVTQEDNRPGAEARESDDGEGQGVLQGLKAVVERGA